MEHTKVRERLHAFLWAYEAIVIATCFMAGVMLAYGHGTLFAALPLILVAAAELLRIPLSGWSLYIAPKARALSWFGLLMISLVSFEGLTIAFEGMVDNRVKDSAVLLRQVAAAKKELETKKAIISENKIALETAKQKVAALDADIANKEKSAPVQPGFSGKTCTGRDGRAVTCDSDRVARADYTAAQTAHIATLKGLREARTSAQTNLDKIAATYSSATAAPEMKHLEDVQTKLAEVLSDSPMHRLAASVFGVSIEELTDDQFQRFKAWAVFGLAGSFATLSMLVSVVTHAPVHEQKHSDGKLSRALRAWIARRRKKVVHIQTVTVEKEVIVEVEKIVEVPGPEKIILRWVPYDFKSGRRVLPDPSAGDGIPVSKIVGGINGR